MPRLPDEACEVDGEPCVRVSLSGAAADRRMLLHARAWERLRAAYGRAWYIRRTREGREVVVSARCERPRNGKRPVRLAQAASRLVTLAAPHETVQSLTGDVTDLRPQSWVVRNTMTGQSRRGDEFTYRRHEHHHAA